MSIYDSSIVDLAFIQHYSFGHHCPCHADGQKRSPNPASVSVRVFYVTLHPDVIISSRYAFSAYILLKIRYCLISLERRIEEGTTNGPLNGRTVRTDENRVNKYAHPFARIFIRTIQKYCANTKWERENGGRR